MKSKWSQDLYIKALRFAAEVHKGQKVPGSDLPYIVHVALVSMEIMAALSVEDGLDGDLAVQCALLHDIIEDTGIPYEKVEAEFGSDVADGVMALSKDKELKTKSEQIHDSLERIKKQPKEISMVKMADRITNLLPPPHFWNDEKIARYKQGAILIYNELKGASPYLADRLRFKIDNYNVDTRRLMMKEVDVILKMVAEGMKAMAQGVEVLAEKLDTIVESGVGKKVKKSKKKKPAAKKAAPKKKTITAVETVLKVISRSKKGISPISISNKTGFPPKKVHNIVYKLKKQGKIKSVGRGFYLKR